MTIYYKARLACLPFEKELILELNRLNVPKTKRLITKYCQLLLVPTRASVGTKLLLYCTYSLALNTRFADLDVQ